MPEERMFCPKTVDAVGQDYPRMTDKAHRSTDDEMANFIGEEDQSIECMMPRHTASFDYPRRLHFKCSKCALCCGDTNTRVRHIVILEREAEQISEITSKPIEEFATKIEGNEPYVYEMRKTKSEGRCLFLKQNTCTIYALRPLICRFYPFQLTAVKDGMYRFSCTEECPGINRGRQLGKRYFENLFQQASGQLGEEMAEEG